MPSDEPVAQTTDVDRLCGAIAERLRRRSATIKSAEAGNLYQSVVPQLLEEIAVALAGSEKDPDHG